MNRVKRFRKTSPETRRFILPSQKLVSCLSLSPTLLSGQPPPPPPLAIHSPNKESRDGEWIDEMGFPRERRDYHSVGNHHQRCSQYGHGEPQ
ncbi:hypothetical protein F0562_008449 [Nyssa sinensis]|uniref:Uncharacterized protein n=1 Tax=Nyssa sinensis TaxID=561372 RepID=A0A5J5A8K9_9ASTE|nr:hypothetical protein F0562_008449 [Nyssa sinensis]